MARTDANPPMPEFREDYVLQEVDAAWLGKAVKPKPVIVPTTTYGRPLARKA